MSVYDIAFVGHVCWDEIVPFSGEARVSPGSAVLQGAIAAARVGMKTAVITKRAPGDDEVVQELAGAGVAVFAADAAQTSRMRVLHPSANPDERKMVLLKSAGPFSAAETPAVDAVWMHLAGISDQEFSLPFIEAMKGRGYDLSIDLQSVVRQVDPATKEVCFAGSSAARRIVSRMEQVKLDGVEAEVLTGLADVRAACRLILCWGCPEVMATTSQGVLVNRQGRELWEPFTNRSIVGRTGRGDTVFAAYLARRFTHSPEEALKFAASLVSIKMETPGPFRGTVMDVEKRMRQDGRTAMSARQSR